MTILDPVALHLLRPVTSRLSNRPTAIPPLVLRRIAEELDAKWTRRGHLLFMIYVIGLLLCYAGGLFYKRFVSVNPTWGIIDITFNVVQFVFMFGVFLITWWIAKRARLPRVCAVMLEHRRCPDCGYDIRALPPAAEDSATVCPECGCAWRLEGIAVLHDS